MNIQEKLASVQKSLRANKSQHNDFGNYYYRSCEDILEAVKPLLADNGLTLLLSDDIQLVGDRFYVKATATIVSSFDGQMLSVTSFAREDESKKGMDACQVTGAASSYARKYALNGLFCIDDAKDSDATNTGQKTNTFVCEKCGKAITAYPDGSGKLVSLRAHAERSKSKFGSVLCLDCIKDASADR